MEAAVASKAAEEERKYQGNFGKREKRDIFFKAHLTDESPRPGQVDDKAEVRLVGRVELEGAGRALREGPELGALRGRAV